MANPEHLAKLKEGVEAFNQWRRENPGVRPDLSEANLSHARLQQVNFTYANLSSGNFSWAYFTGADLGWANLGGAILWGADLENANLGWANLIGAVLTESSLIDAKLLCADLTEVDLRYANLRRATLVETNLERANLMGCSVYGISAWNVRLAGAIQTNLSMNAWMESPLEVDNLEFAQFIHLLLNNAKIRDVIDTITSKVVLILGRFTPERKSVLDAIREELRRRNYLPVLFDFEKPASRNFTETVSTLAHMSRFVIADLTDPRSIPQELMRIIPDLPSVPVQPLVLASQNEYGMFPDFRTYPWVLEPFRYVDQGTLLAELGQKVIEPAEKKAKERSGK